MKDPDELSSPHAGGFFAFLYLNVNRRSQNLFFSFLFFEGVAE